MKRDSTSEYLNGPVPDFGTTIPLSLSMKPKDPEDEGKDGPNALAVDENGKVVVTKYDILFGRGRSLVRYQHLRSGFMIYISFS